MPIEDLIWSAAAGRAYLKGDENCAEMRSKLAQAQKDKDLFVLDYSAEDKIVVDCKTWRAAQRNLILYRVVIGVLMIACELLLITR